GDPKLAARLEAHRRLRARLDHAYGGAMQEPAPERWRRMIEASERPVVIDLERERARRRRPAPVEWRPWAAVAASLVAGLVIGQLILPAKAPSVIGGGPLGLVAQGPL